MCWFEPQGIGKSDDLLEQLSGATTPEQLQARIKAKYPDLALDIVLRIGSEAAALARR